MAAFRLGAAVPAVAAVERLRQVLEDAPATEAELRSLLEQAGGWERTLRGRVAASEQRLRALADDTASPLAQIAAELRHVEPLRRELHETQSLIEQLEQRARELRSAWLLRSASR